MDADATVRRSLYYFPTLYRDRWSVLEHIVCAFGTRYSWENGELVCPTDYAALEREDPHHSDPRVALEQACAEFREWRGLAEADAIPERHLAHLRADAEAMAATVAFVRGNLDELAETRIQPDEITTMHRPEGGEVWSPLAAIPDDVTASWLDACEEVAGFVLVAPRSSAYPQDPRPDPARTPRELTAHHRRMFELTDPSARDRSDAELLTGLARETARMAAEWDRRVREDAGAVRENRAIAREALERIAEIRRSRQGVDRGGPGSDRTGGFGGV